MQTIISAGAADLRHVYKKQLPLITQEGPCRYRGVQPFGVSGPQWKKKSCLGPHTKYIATYNHKKSHNVFSKFTILAWAAFIATPGCMPPVGHGLDTQRTSRFIANEHLLVYEVLDFNNTEFEMHNLKKHTREV